MSAFGWANSIQPELFDHRDTGRERGQDAMFCFPGGSRQDTTCSQVSHRISDAIFDTDGSLRSIREFDFDDIMQAIIA